MGIEPFTFLAQLVNFLILVALLKRFLYLPVLGHMDERNRMIGQQLEKANQDQQRADELAGKVQVQLAEVEQLRTRRLAELAAEIEQARQQGLERVRQEVAEIGQRWKEKQARELESQQLSENQRVAQLLLRVARAALADLANSDLEQQMVQVLLNQAEALPRGSTQISSAFALPAPLQQRLLERFPGSKFRIEPELLAGLVLRLDDQKVGWCLSAYLDGLSERLRQC